MMDELAELNKKAKIISEAISDVEEVSFTYFISDVANAVELYRFFYN
jgi:hypothetical protein